MRIELSLGDLVKTIEVPKDADMMGIMIQRDGGMQGTVLQFEAEGISCHEEELFNDNHSRVLALYYRAPELSDVMQAFAGFEGMTCIEVQEGNTHIRVIV